MKTLLFAIIISFSSFHITFANQGVLNKTQELIRVRLEKNKRNITLSGYSLTVLGATSSYKKISIPQLETIQIKTIYFNNKFVLQVGNKIIAHAVIQIHGRQLKIGEKRLPSELLLSINNSTGDFDVIGVVPMDEYLVGVVASEMPAHWPVETLKAQAVAARSYALSVVKERANHAYHVESTVLDQVFQSITPEDSKYSFLKKIIEETKRYSLVKNNKIFKSFYHSDCGGKTKTPQSVWGFGEDGGVAKDSACPSNPKARWNYVLDYNSLTQKISDFILESVSVSQIKILNQNAKPQALLVATAQPKTLSFEQLRKIIGYDKIKSTNLEFVVTQGQLKVSGQGYGHGVGLCQWGSKYLGDQGFSFQKILKHYYPKVHLFEKSISTPGTAFATTLNEQSI